MAYERGGNFPEDAGKKLNREARRPRQSRFSIGSAPGQASRNLTLKSVVAKPDRTIKIPSVSPVAPSCALLFLPFGLPVSLRCYGRVYLIPRLTLSSGRQFAPSWTVCTNPVQSDRCVLSGNYRLESNPERHNKTPLAAAIGKRVYKRLLMQSSWKSEPY